MQPVALSIIGNLMFVKRLATKHMRVLETMCGLVSPCTKIFGLFQLFGEHAVKAFAVVLFVTSFELDTIPRLP
jgi:hypothetical protein